MRNANFDISVSIITVVFNADKDLEETILSVINQNYPNYEYIIVDGDSQKNTIDVIRKYDDSIDVWISEPDKGIYDAMNKGIKLARGKWVNFMNAGDKFVDSERLRLIEFDKYTDHALIYGNKILNNSMDFPLDIKMLKKGEIMACHQSMFFNKGILKNQLYYDLRFPIYADYELVNRIYNKNYNMVYVDINIAVFQGNGISSEISFQKRKDKYRIIFNSYGLIGLVKAIIFRIKKSLNSL